MMNNKIYHTISEYNMLSTGDTVVVGVSGGADSMLLLTYLMSVQNVFELKIIAAHIEHGIRGKESEADALFVKNFCKKNNIEFRQKSINAVSEAKDAGVGIEEYSRNVRYDFFNSIPCDKIATAHNLSDVCETALFRLSRGTSLKGLCSVPAVRGKIIRPLIKLTSDEIRRYCSDNGIEYRIDSTNSDNDYSRNYIRNQIIPDFKKLNPSFEQAVSRFIESAKADEALLQKCAETALNMSLCSDNKAVNISKLLSFSESEIRRALIIFADKYNIALDENHLLCIMNLLHNKGKTQIKGNYFAVSNGEMLTIESIDVTDKSCNESVGFIAQANIIPITEFLNIRELSGNNIDFYCDCDKIIGKVFVRSRLSGDTVSPAGRGCTKSLKKIYNEYKIPCESRNNIAVVCDGGGVIGIAGYCCDERVKVTRSTKSVFILKSIRRTD